MSPKVLYPYLMPLNSVSLPLNLTWFLYPFCTGPTLQGFCILAVLVHHLFRSVSKLHWFNSGLYLYCNGPPPIGLYSYCTGSPQDLNSYCVLGHRRLVCFITVFLVCILMHWPTFSRSLYPNCTGPIQVCINTAWFTSYRFVSFQCTCSPPLGLYPYSALVHLFRSVFLLHWSTFSISSDQLYVFIRLYIKSIGPMRILYVF